MSAAPSSMRRCRLALIGCAASTALEGRHSMALTSTFLASFSTFMVSPHDCTPPQGLHRGVTRCNRSDGRQTLSLAARLYAAGVAQATAAAIRWLVL